MKTILTALLLCLAFAICKGQTTPPISERHPVLDGNGNPINYDVSPPRSNIILLLKADTLTRSIRPLNQIPNDPMGSIVFLEGAKQVQVTTRIKADSLRYYRYSIIENDTTVILRDGQLVAAVGGSPGIYIMDLMIPEVTGKKVTVKIHRLPETDKVTTLIIYNKPLERVKILEKYLISDDPSNKNQRNAKSLGDNANIYIDRNTKGITLSLRKTDLDFAYAVYVLHHIDRKTKFTFVQNSDWDYKTRSGNSSIFIDRMHFRELGDYEIKIIPDPRIAGIGEVLDNTAHIINSRGQMLFRVVSIPGAFSIREMGIIAMLILMAVICIALLIIERNKKKGRKKIMQAHFKTEATKSELDQIRSQLNPHFVYNSLSGIQNLMNQNETEKANSYLSKFARLTRNILNDQELISIQDERNLLDDYLSMESLRFKFSYEINIIGDANFPNTEIPAMLLQPFVENAVKHNMATLQDKGKLLIELKAIQKNVILSVNDNGRGFDIKKTYDGMGLKLCRKRIDLLNELYKECPISMTIASTSTGTTVTITLENWL